MRNEVVKHHNDLNSMIMRKWTSEEMNFFFSILSKAREHGTTRLYFDTYELKELSNFSKKHNQRWEDTMENVARKVTQLNYVEKTDYKIRAMTLFNWFEVDLKDKTVEIELSNNFESGASIKDSHLFIVVSVLLVYLMFTVTYVSYPGFWFFLHSSASTAV